MNRSDRFPLKKVIIGVRQNGMHLAVPLEEFRPVAVANVGVGGQPLALFYDSSLDTIGAFRRTAEEQTLSFELRSGGIVDIQTETLWSSDGVGLEGPFQGVSLQRVNAFNAMWFAWYAFHPDTAVYG